ncbi:hypothetical protein Tco_1054602 [Tanacetum coccineum]|uniref:Uncharacterized protein n=1 Tax=Tanacetum coccineum TaxID=301880 RepID=A0ABQ5GXY3_9ASTR
MFDIVPPMPPPFGANISNPSSPNRAGNPIDNININNTNNVRYRNVVDENLPQLLDSRGGSRVTNVLEFDKEDFSSWKDRLLVYLYGLEPYLLEILENGPFVPCYFLTKKMAKYESNYRGPIIYQNDTLSAALIVSLDIEGRPKGAACSFMLCDLDFEPLSLSSSSFPSCDLVSLANILILCLILKASKSELAEGLHEICYGCESRNTNGILVIVEAIIFKVCPHPIIWHSLADNARTTASVEETLQCSVVSLTSNY